LYDFCFVVYSLPAFWKMIQNNKQFNRRHTTRHDAVAKKIVTFILALRKNGTMAKKSMVILALILFPLEWILCQGKDFKISALKTEIAPKIDGILDENVWKGTPMARGFFQYEPSRGEPSSLMTEVKILYDDDYIYFGFICFDPDPEKIVLGSNKRDGLTAASGTDSVTVIVDTFHDKRTGYYLRTNPVGVQHDGRVADNGRVADTNWDGIWRSAGAINSEGWTAEIAIPFKTLKFNPGKNRTWGIQFSRYLPRRFEKSFWVGPLKEDYRKLSTYGTLTGLNLENYQHRSEIIPHIISSSEEGKKTSYDTGLDASYDFTQSISGHLTINPDFATVEADREQVNLTRFELHFPEKRYFFLEGNSIYKQSIRLFYSRRITDIYGGAKLYGKAGRNEFSFLSAQTKKNEEGTANFSAFRLKRDIIKSSTLGFSAANKFANGKNQGTLGLDTTHDFTKNLIFKGQVALSYGDANRNDLAFFLRPSFDSTTFHIHFCYTYLGKYFADNANAVGFIKDDNRHELDSAIKKTFWLKKYGLDRIEYNSKYNIYWGMDKTLRSWDIFQSLTFDLKNKFSFKFLHNQGYKLYEKKFINYRSLLELGYNMREWHSAFISYEFGKNFDSDFTLISGRLSQNIFRNLSLEYNLTKLSFSPDPEDESTWIHVILANQYFTKDIFFKVFYQINSVINKKNLQIVFVYRFQPPFGLIQLAYQKGTAEHGEKGTQSHTLFLKFAYVF